MLLSLLATAAVADTPPAPELAAVVQAVEKRYAEVTTLQAAFVQTSHSSLYGDDRQAGMLFLERPNHMRWEFETDHKLFLADGTHLWIATPADHQVLKSVQVEGAGGADVLLTSLAHLSERFEASLVPEPGVTHLALAPREKDAAFSKIEVVLDGELALKRLVLTDMTGTVTDLAFTDVKLGAALAPELFQMVVPEGATVVDMGG
ncbi:MAG: outer membrane lipoprotein carrier protein LolA [Alphaproteobacteria bacterium]|nr:outer membrane lipoprotein carrier protein LolA [Alphaproteobacteria bacterium]MCB9697771.1 outer membrane lipoprotein carrier protein LolA [Alphaproteobacteria bacterium]